MSHYDDDMHHNHGYGWMHIYLHPHAAFCCRINGFTRFLIGLTKIIFGLHIFKTMMESCI